MNSNFETQAELLTQKQEQSLAQEDNLATFLKDLGAVLEIFKYDLSDFEGEAAQQMLLELQTFKAKLSPEKLLLLRGALSWAVDTQNTQVITDFLRQFSPASLPVEQRIQQVSAWQSRQVALN